MDLNQLTEFELNEKIEEFSPGDTVRVSVKVTEGDRTRIQNFEGTVIRKRGAGMSSTFTVRRVSNLTIKSGFSTFWLPALSAKALAPCCSMKVCFS